MAAYAAVVSLMHIIKQIQTHPSPPISLNVVQVESFIKKLTFLQGFLENYSSIDGGDDGDGLESRIANAAFAAEDILESHIVDQILARSRGKEEISSIFDLYQGLQNVIQEMDLIKRDVEFIKETWIHDMPRKIPFSDLSLKSPSMKQNTTMVGLDDVLIQVMDKLTNQQSRRQIISIAGMGGIGKTTLARNIYVNPLIVQYFDCCGWVTISQEFTAKEILLQILISLKTTKTSGSLSQMSENELGEILHKRLSGRRYLIVLDDIWSIEAWDIVKFFLQDNNNGSRTN